MLLFVTIGYRMSTPSQQGVKAAFVCELNPTEKRAVTDTASMPSNTTTNQNSKNVLNHESTADTIMIGGPPRL